ncbi:MAG: NADP-specific glutamate dehydrogenase [Treponema sp.]|nr:NADP-specific glutamate dehydrogenase [Treponema sp.]
MSYIDKIITAIERKDAGQPEFLQASKEVLQSLRIIADSDSTYEKAGLLERLIEPERMIVFRVPWVDDCGKVMVNRGFRVQYNSAIGPYKGGIRFHPSVNASIIKFLGFEQTFKNALTGLPMGGGKGGCDFDPKGKSDGEVMRFCQSFMTELFRHIGPDTDVPAGDIGVGAREVGFMYGQYKRIMNNFTGVLTGKGIGWGGSLGRAEATGYGLIYIIEEYLDKIGDGFKGKNVVISGSGNVSIYAAQKAMALGSTVVSMSDSNGYIYHKSGINLDTIKDIKFVNRERLTKYAEIHKDAIYTEANSKPGSSRVWDIPCDIALPCATQNELFIEDAKKLVQNGCKIVGEGANMPATLDATEYLINGGVAFFPGKAANAGGVSVSGLEMTQNSTRLSWTSEEVDAKLKTIMKGIFNSINSASEEYGVAGVTRNFVIGANIAGFKKVAKAMLDQGVI